MPYVCIRKSGSGYRTGRRPSQKINVPKKPQESAQVHYDAPTQQITHMNTPSDAKVQQQKPVMDSVIRKLEGLNIKRKNISFDI